MNLMDCDSMCVVPPKTRVPSGPRACHLALRPDAGLTGRCTVRCWCGCSRGVRTMQPRIGRASAATPSRDGGRGLREFAFVLRNRFPGWGRTPDPCAFWHLAFGTMPLAEIMACLDRDIAVP